MIRTTMIALATVAALGAGSLSPALAAGPAAAPSARIAAAGESPVIEVGGRYRYDDARRHAYHENDVRQGRAFRGRTCVVRQVRTVRWTPHGKIVRLVPEKTCFAGGPRRGWR